MFYKLFLLALAAATYALPSAAPTSAPSPNPSQVSISSISYGGTGCPQGSLGSYISPDLETFTLIFDDYVASVGPGISITEERKNCQLLINLQYPSGFQYSILSTDYRGYMQLDSGVSAAQEATFYFSGEVDQASVTHNFYGPYDDDYEVVDYLSLTSTVWSPCGSPEPLNIDSQVRLLAHSANETGLITNDSIDGKLTFVVGVQWQQC